MGHTVDAVDSYVVRGKPGAPAPPGAALCAKSGRGDMGASGGALRACSYQVATQVGP